MEDAFDADPLDRHGLRHPLLEAELASLIDVRGASLVDQPAQLRLLLTQASPEASRHIDALLAAAACGVAGRLRAASDDAQLPALLARGVEQVRANGVADEAWAAWAVRAWAHAFALPTSPTATREPASSPPAAPFAPWQHAAPIAPSSGSFGPEIAVREAARGTSPIAPSPAEPMPAPPPIRSVDEPIEARGTGPVGDLFAPFPTAAPVAATPPARSGGDAGATMATSAAATSGDAAFAFDDAADHAAEVSTAAAPSLFDAPLEARAEEESIAASDAPVATAPHGGIGLDADAPLAPPTTAKETEASSAPSSASSSASLFAAPFASSSSPPAWARADDDPRADRIAPTGGARRRRAWIPLVAGIALLALSAAWLATRRTESPATASVVGAVAPTAANDAEPSAPVATRPTASADATNGSPSAAGAPPVASTAPADKAQGVAAAPSPTPPASSASTSGTAPADRTAATVETVPAATSPSAAKSTSPPIPARARADAPRRLAIAGIAAPRAVAGRPFIVTLKLAGGARDARDVSVVERRFYVSEGTWPKSDSVAVGSGVERHGGTVRVWFRAPQAPARAAVEFVVVGRSGARSEPRTLNIKVAEVSASPPSTASSTAAASPASPPAAAAPAGSGTNAACTATTCGVVVEARELDSASALGVPIYRIVVRTDERETHSFVVSYRLQSGTRVRIVGGRIVPIAGSGN